MVGALLTGGYRGDGLRAWKQAGSTRTYFLYDDDTPVIELSSAGAVTATNTFGAAGLLARRVSSTSTFYQFDPQGSVVQRLNSSGTPQTNYCPDAWGVWSSSGAAATDPWVYGAQWGYFTDRETGLLLLTHRFYDPGTGRFLNLETRFLNFSAEPDRRPAEPGLSPGTSFTAGLEHEWPLAITNSGQSTG